MELNDILEPYSFSQRKHLCNIAKCISAGLLLATYFVIRSGIFAYLYGKVIAGGAGVANPLLFLIPTGFFTFCRLVDYYDSNLTIDSSHKKRKIKLLITKRGKSMKTVKSKKVDNQTVIPMPNEFKIQANQEFVIHKSKDGSITMVPKISNPYQGPDKFEPASDNKDFEVEGMKQMTDEDN